VEEAGGSVVRGLGSSRAAIGHGRGVSAEIEMAENCQQR